MNWLGGTIIGGIQRLAAATFLGVNWVGWLIIGGITGALAARVVNGRGYGIPLDVLIGVVAGLIGGWAATNLLHVGGGGVVFVSIVAFMSSVVLLWLLHRVAGLFT